MSFRVLPKEIETLWTLFTAPVVWAVHFVLCYVAAAIFCQKLDRTDLSFDSLRLAILAATVVALALILTSGYLAWRQWGFGAADPPHDDPTRKSRLLFQGFSTLLLSALSFVAVVFTAMPALFIPACVP